jgi:large subunit ribosomal protein L29
VKAEKVREMSEDELLKKEEELQDQLLRLRIQNATAQLDRPEKIRDARKDLARVKTVLGERRRAESGSR